MSTTAAALAMPAAMALALLHLRQSLRASSLSRSCSRSLSLACVTVAVAMATLVIASETTLPALIVFSSIAGLWWRLALYRGQPRPRRLRFSRLLPLPLPLLPRQRRLPATVPWQCRSESSPCCTWALLVTLPLLLLLLPTMRRLNLTLTPARLLVPRQACRAALLPVTAPFPPPLRLLPRFFTRLDPPLQLLSFLPQHPRQRPGQPPLELWLRRRRDLNLSRWRKRNRSPSRMQARAMSLAMTAQ